MDKKISNTSIIIVGTGASGLMAGRLLSQAGFKIIFLEGNSYPGGRIHTIKHADNTIFETGAEFIHGNLPITFQLINEAKIEVNEVNGISWQFRNGKFSKEENFIDDWPLLIEKLESLQEDISMKNFLDKYFVGEKYERLKISVKKFLEGYDAGTLDTASAFALKEEWLGENNTKQFRIVGGYIKLIDYLYEQCVQKNAQFFFNSIVASIEWKKDYVKITTNNNQFFEGDVALITIPIGTLQPSFPHQQKIKFIPQISEKQDAAQHMGFGAVIKFLLKFKISFWENFVADPAKETKLDQMTFLFTDAQIPTWWTQYPQKSTLLTGWLAGPQAEKLQGMAKSNLLEVALNSLGTIFNLSNVELMEMLEDYKIIDWSSDSMAGGAYSYATVGSKEYKKIILQPLLETVYFAGEALHNGPEIGTVEAALACGSEIARVIMNSR